MKPAVLSIFTPFTKRLEGCVQTMYLDVKGLVTIGYGCLIDPMPMALTLPFKDRGTGKPATTAEIRGDWMRVKSQPGLAKLHWKYAAVHCRLMLDMTGVIALMNRRLELVETQLKVALPKFDEWPADAQLATVSMAWAMGAGFPRKFPKWTDAANQRQWGICAEQCQIRTDGNPGIVPRNRANKALFLAAATGSNPDVITLEATGL